MKSGPESSKPSVPDFIPDGVLTELQADAREVVIFDHQVRELDSDGTSPAALWEQVSRSVRRARIGQALLALVIMVLAPSLWLAASPTSDVVFYISALVTSLSTYFFLRSCVHWAQRHKKQIEWFINQAGTRPP